MPLKHCADAMPRTSLGTHLVAFAFILDTGFPEATGAGATTRLLGLASMSSNGFHRTCRMRMKPTNTQQQQQQRQHQHREEDIRQNTCMRVCLA